ncbi:MAG: hypothetical protein M3349_05485 [Actinomycetota bacterium]|nr:hypothetical protein [Actinomycetota bacterium]
MMDAGWGFTTPAEARSYLGEVGRLWLAWLVGLVALVALQGWAVLVAGLMVMGALVWLIRPLQARTERLVPDGAADVGLPQRGWGSARDRMMRRLAYGAEPISAAVSTAGAGRWWLVARWFMIGATVAAVVWVVAMAAAPPA